MNIEHTRQCTKCGQIKPLTAFHNHAKSRGGKNSRCKVCRAEDNKQHNNAHPNNRRRYTSLCKDAEMVYRLDRIDICVYIRIKKSARRAKMIQSMRNTSPARAAYFKTLGVC